MDNIRTLIKKSPAPVVIQTLRTTLTLPPTVANGLISDLTKPNNEQKKWIKTSTTPSGKDHWLLKISNIKVMLMPFAVYEAQMLSSSKSMVMI